MQDNIKLLVVVLSVLIYGCTGTTTVPEYYHLEWPVTEVQYADSLPDDVYADSGSRLPFVKREELLSDEQRAFYDSRRAPGSRSLGGIRGPGSVRLHGSPSLAESRVDKRTQELVRLVVSREMDQPFEWTLHEPVALENGLEPEIIDVIRYRKSLDGVPEREASIIQWGRELFQTHSVSVETFARILRNVGKRDLVDLTTYMGNYTTTAILLHTIDAHLPYEREPLLPLP
ncbi:MAG: carboxymuconolactone decarboxylase family protein [Gammaproteobacteria bacterium]|nr:carboxymuconolactone decarboxylase family protein [Gammaproteobacteria bacterium]